MIYEMRTYDMKPGSMRDAEKRFGESYAEHQADSQLVAFWHTALGPLNQLVYVWRYESLADRERGRSARGKSTNWPPGLNAFSAFQRSEILIPVPGCPELAPGTMGPIFEMCSYSLAPGELPVAIENWQRALPARNAFKPAAAVCYTDIGGLDKLIAVWPYESYEQRDAIRAEARATGNWPPSELARKEGRRACVYTARESKILAPAAFSPVR